MADINETLKLLNEWIEDENATNAEIDGWLVSDAIDLLTDQKREIERLKEQPHWIPVSERKPHTSGTYIVAKRVFEGDDIYILSSACYFDGSDTWYNDNRLNHERPYVNDKIIAWMPLPEPPKDGEQK